MGQIVVDAAFREKLRQAEGSVEFIDESGKVLGYYSPAFDPEKWEILGPEVSEEELDRRLKSDKWYTTAEVLARLEKLP